MEIIPVAMMDDVLKHALVRMPEPIEWDEVAEEAAAAARALAEKIRRGRPGALSLSNHFFQIIRRRSILVPPAFIWARHNPLI